MKKIAIILLTTFSLSLGASCFASSYNLSTLRGNHITKTQSLSDTGTGSIGSES
jgi:hypothetical protein